MACNCASNKYVAKLVKKYGYENDIALKELLQFKFKNMVYIIGAVLCMSIFAPLIIMYFMINIFLGNTHFSVNKFLGKNNKLTEYVREQQELQDKD